MKTVKMFTLPASVLASVLVVCTLMLLGTLGIIALWTSELSAVGGFHYRERQQANIASGFVCYEMDSTLMTRLAPDSSLLLYPEDASSRVAYKRERWGMYELLTVSAGGGYFRSVRLVGKVAESGRNASLYMPENDHSLSLAGKVELPGEVWLSRAGLHYTQVRRDFFSGERISPERLHVGGLDFPLSDRETQEVIAELFEPEPMVTEVARNGRRSFCEPVVLMIAEDTLRSLSLSGRVILWNRDRVYIDRQAHLENVIVVGRKVTVGEGFHGSVQVFASDSILVEKQVVLGAGSGLYVKGELSERLISLENGCRVEGYVVIDKGMICHAPVRANYFQSPGAYVEGLVYIDGVADVHGEICGRLYVRECCYFAPEGYYAGFLYDVSVKEDISPAYPLWMEGPYERRCMKWLY